VRWRSLRGQVSHKRLKKRFACHRLGFSSSGGYLDAPIAANDDKPSGRRAFLNEAFKQAVRIPAWPCIQRANPACGFMASLSLAWLTPFLTIADERRLVTLPSAASDVVSQLIEIGSSELRGEHACRLERVVGVD